MNKFEQLIEYVINDESDKASDLFHEIVVEKSREIYEGLMDEEGVDSEVEEIFDEVASDEEGVAEEFDDLEAEGGDEFGGMDDLEASGEEEFEITGDDELGFDNAEGEADGELEDRVVDLEDKLDELMAEFDELMAHEEGEEEAEAGGEEFEAGEEEAEETGEEEAGEEEVEEGFDATLDENVSLTSAPKPVTSEEGSVNKKSTNADNAGKKAGTKGSATMSSGEESGRKAPTAKDMGGTTSPSQGAAPKATTGEESGTNTKSTI